MGAGLGESSDVLERTDPAELWASTENSTETANNRGWLERKRGR